MQWLALARRREILQRIMNPISLFANQPIYLSALLKRVIRKHLTLTREQFILHTGACIDAACEQYPAGRAKKRTGWEAGSIRGNVQFAASIARVQCLGF